MTIEHEEYEQIPWSSLVGEAEHGIDRRWILAVVAVGAIFFGYFGLRLIGPDDQPALPRTEALEVVTSTTERPEPQLVVSEDQLRGGAPDAGEGLIALRAEWFVTDFFTHDGSEETARSVRNALVPGIDEAALAPAAAGADDPQTYVEWARAVQVEPSSAGAHSVLVFYRTIESSDAGFVRLPVRAVRIGIAFSDGVPRVASVMSDVPVRWPTPDPAGG